MSLNIEYTPRAFKDLRSLQSADRALVLAKIGGLRNGFSPDVKRLTNFTPEYRLRAGDYRILFEVEGDNVIIYHIKHRKDAYR